MKHSAFTLVELLVVIAIVILLAGILLPAINGARESARRGQCIARQRDLALALTAHQNEANGLPGYVETVGTFTSPVFPQRHLPWFFLLYPHIGETKRFEALTQAEITDIGAIAAAIEPVSAGICPAARTETPLNYVVNCGPHALSGDDAILTNAVTPHFTLFRDRRVICHNNSGSIVPPGGWTDLRVAPNAKVKLDEIPDGASATIILSENLEAVALKTLQFNTPLLSGSDKNIWFNINELNRPCNELGGTRHSVLVRSLGFEWSNKTVELTSNTAWTSPYTPNILPQRPSGGAVPGVFPPTERPSSNHRGTVITAYADSSVKPMNVAINAGVYLELVCPDAVRATKSVNNGGLGYTAATP